jgi:hypothetical protein
MSLRPHVIRLCRLLLLWGRYTSNVVRRTGIIAGRRILACFAGLYRPLVLWGRYKSNVVRRAWSIARRRILASFADLYGILREGILGHSYKIVIFAVLMFCLSREHAPASEYVLAFIGLISLGGYNRWADSPHSLPRPDGF